MMHPFWISFICFYGFFQYSRCRTVAGDVPGAEFDGNETYYLVQVKPSEEFLDTNNEVPKLGKVEKDESKTEMIPVYSAHRGQKRQPRTILSKIHSGASFLAGLKLGKILSKKGFELGHGKIASSHTFQLFGKTVNSATSLSYGDNIPFLPSLDDSPVQSVAPGGPIKKDVLHVTVIENPSDKTVEKLQDIVYDDVVEKKEANETNRGGEVDVKKQAIRLYQDEDKENDSFLREHNKLVKEINRNILKRANSKF